MWTFLVIVGVFLRIFVGCSTGPAYPPTKGEVWPKPQHEMKNNNYFTFSPTHFQVHIVKHECEILSKAIERYWQVMKNMHRFVGRDHLRTEGRPRRNLCAIDENEMYQGNIKVLKVALLTPCEEYPYMDMDESYNLTVSPSARLRSYSIWGMLRGLETFAQLFYLADNYEDILINETVIIDYPRYPYRGVLLDTGRHYLTMENILKTLDAMAMNKMNVFHWHIVDDQSFPYQSEKFPEISLLGAYHPSLIYTKADVQAIINYARDRGIRVVPEFDVPGHTQSWGVAYPNILTPCYDHGRKTRLGPLNPILNITYKLLQELFDEVQELFPDKYFHIGGDEVDTHCWSTNPDITEFMKKFHIDTVSQLHAVFIENTMPFFENKTNLIIWQDAYDINVTLPKSTLIQVWKYHWVEEMVKILKAGYKVVFSSSWYLDILGSDFKDMYSADPRRMVRESTGSDALGVHIVGGEACMWGEMADDTNLLSRTWPRASAVAEVLWSPEAQPGAPAVPRAALRRVGEHTCRMRRRGVPAQPAAGPGFCLL